MNTCVFTLWQTKVELTYVHVYGYLISKIKNFEQIRDTTLTLQGNDGRWARSRRLNREHYPPSSVQLGGTSGEKLSNFWNFVAIRESFLHKICGLAFFDAAKANNPQKFSPWKLYLLPIHNFNFLSWKFPAVRYESLQFITAIDTTTFNFASKRFPSILVGSK